MSNSSERPSKIRTTILTKGIRSVLRGRVSFGRATLEAFRRGRAAVRSRRERATLADLALQPARLRAEFQNLSSSDLLKHFRERPTPSFLPGFELAESTASRQRDLFPDETEALIESTWTITKEHRWPLLGFGEKEFGRPIDWHRDPLSGRIWPLDYHADIPLWHDDGSDIRVLWELNRLGHLIALSRAYAVTKEEAFAAECFAQVESWREQNPVARGANWSCAMEVALRAMNLLAACSLFRSSPSLNEERLLMLLTMFEQHGAHIRRNLEFSHIATSNHYLSDVTGLLWIGIAVPELSAAAEWRDWALGEMLREMDKQILPDGADYEASTGYHRFVLELFLYSFILCRANNITIAEKYWRKLHLMLVYLRGYLRPDGLAPLVGDTDGGQVLPLVSRSADEHAFLLPIGAVVFGDSQFKLPGQPASEELLWILGEQGMRDYENLNANSEPVESQAFPEAGTYVLRSDDLYLLFNTSGNGVNGRGSHGHNDALSIEVSACGCPFIVDPGTYVYTADLHERELFRSTAYHSTVQVDNVEQNSMKEEIPFVIGDEANPRVVLCESGAEFDRVVAEHEGYGRLPQPVTHRRAVTFNKRERWWLIEDAFRGVGQHDFAVRFHFDSGLKVSVYDDMLARGWDGISGATVFVFSLDVDQKPALESQFTSRDYGEKKPSTSARWSISGTAPCSFRWAIVPACANDNYGERLGLIARLRELISRPLRDSA